MLAIKAHDEERLDHFEYARIVAFSSLRPYLEPGTTIDKFWSIPERDIRGDDEEKRSEAKKFMDEVTAKYKEFYNR